MYFKGREGPKKVSPERLQSGQPQVTERQDPPLQARLPRLQEGQDGSGPLGGHLMNPPLSPFSLTAPLPSQRENVSVLSWLISMPPHAGPGGSSSPFQGEDQGFGS